MAAELTKYVVLIDKDGNGSWSVFGDPKKPTEARTKVEAIKEATRVKGADHHEPGKFRAVAANSWGDDEDIVIIETETQPVSSFKTAADARKPKTTRTRKPKPATPPAQEPPPEPEDDSTPEPAAVPGARQEELVQS